jgi:hypothetical protein
MIGNISPSSSSSEHTLNTLRYADRVKELRAKQQNLNFPNGEFSPKLYKPNNIEIPFKNGFKLNTTKNSRNNSKKNTFLANKSVNIQEKKDNIISLANLNCYKGRNKAKISSEKAITKDVLNISGINFFNNIPAIKITKKTILSNNNLQQDKEKENNDDQISDNCFSNKNINKNMRNTCKPKNASSSILDFNSPERIEKESKEKSYLIFNSAQENDEILSDDNSLKNNNIKDIKKTKSGLVGFQFLNNYQNFKDKDIGKNITKKVCFENANNEELEELKKKKKMLQTNIANEQKKCIERHKTHIDYIVNLMKKEMNFIDVVEEKSNINLYVEQMLKIFHLEELKIQKIKKNFNELNSIIKEKDEIDKKIKILMEQNETKDDSMNCLSNINFNSSGGSGLSGNFSQLCDAANENNLSHSITDDIDNNENEK